MAERLRNGLASASAIALILVTAASHAEPAQPAPNPQQPDPVATNDPAFMSTFTQQYRDAFANGAIPAKYKQLSGVTLSVVLKCEECLKSHVQMAIKLGATRQEIVESLRIGLLTGGSAGLPTMGVAYSVMDGAKLK
jgi:AhpD family alkylhydroperoxidase